MASKTKIATVAPPTYIEFEPYCEWKKEEGAETLVLKLDDFKKDQLRVQVNNLGILKVSGDQPVKEDGTIRRRFIKETKLPQGCDMNDIHAKFSGGNLYVTMPIKTNLQGQEELQKQKEKALGKTVKDDHMFGLGDALGRLQTQKKVTLGVAVAAIVAIGAYAAYKYGSSSCPPSNIED